MQQLVAIRRSVRSHSHSLLSMLLLGHSRLDLRYCIAECSRSILSPNNPRARLQLWQSKPLTQLPHDFLPTQQEWSWSTHRLVPEVVWHIAHTPFCFDSMSPYCSWLMPYIYFISERCFCSRYLGVPFFFLSFSYQHDLHQL